jgi:type I restriction enzyme R subunit
VLLVAEKYQTGFDQPLLHTMYVDKRLSGIQAVQTLSRLNRTHPQKEDTFILDFVNQPEEIREAFQQFYEGAELGQEAEPAQLYQLKSQLDASGIYLSEEIKRFCAIYFKPKQRQSPADHQGMNAVLDPAVDRFRALYEQNIEEAELWRRKLTAFRNLYSFLSQIIPYQDSDLEQIYIFLRHLSPKLLRHSNEDQYDFDSDIQLEYYRLQKISEGSIHLEKAKKSPLDGPKAVGTAILRENSVKLSQLIDLLNSRFGTDFNQADQLFFDQIVEAAANSEELQQAAQVNSPDKFTLLFNKIVESLFIERVDQNEAIFARYMNDNDFKQFVSNWLVSQVYKRLQ